MATSIHACQREHLAGSRLPCGTHCISQLQTEASHDACNLISDHPGSNDHAEPREGQLELPRQHSCKMLIGFTAVHELLQHALQNMAE